MSYNINPFETTNYGIDSGSTENTTIYKDPIKRETIYEKVKINKPIVMPVIYSNSKTLTQNLNYNNYNTEYTQKSNANEYTNYNNITYGQTGSNDIYNDNYDNNTYGQTSNTYNYNNQSSNNYDYNNLIYGQSTNSYNNNDYNNLIYNNQTTGFVDNISYDNLYSTPYITNVVEDNEITYLPESNQINANKIEFAEITKLVGEEENIVYEQKPNEVETNLLANSNVTFGKNTIGSSESKNKESMKTQTKISNNTNININSNAQQKYNNKANEVKNNEQIPISIKNQPIVRQIPTYEKVAKVRKIIDDEIPFDSNSNKNNILNKKVEKEIVNTNNINITDKLDNIKPKVYDANMKLDYGIRDPRVELPPKKEVERETNPIYKTMERPENKQNLHLENLEQEEEGQMNNNIEENNKTNNIEFNNNLKLKEKAVTPLRGPLDDYNSRSKTPLISGFHEVRIMKKNPSQKTFFVEDKFLKNIQINRVYPKNVRNNEENLKINVVKLNNIKNNKSVGYNDFNKNKNIEFNNTKESNTFNVVKKVDRKKKSNDSVDNCGQIQNFDDLNKLNINSKNEEDFNDISEIQYESNINNESEHLPKEENNYGNYNDIHDNKKYPKDEIKNDDYENTFNDNGNNNNSKMEYFDFDDSNMNFNVEEKKDSNLLNDDINDNTLKKIKNNNDGLDEFDNNFNNHDRFYNKMKRIFDD